MVRDVTIQNNRFAYCGETPILIKPENSRHAGAVHKNIRILGNTFASYKGEAIRIKSAENIRVQGNTFMQTGKQIHTENTENLQSDI